MNPPTDRGLLPANDPASTECGTVSPARAPRPTRPRRRPWKRTDPLIEGLLVEGLDQLDALCGERLARRLLELSRWDPQRAGKAWVVSDTNIMVLSFAVSPGAEAYVQLISSPVEPTVLWEVVSAQYQPSLESWLTPARTESLLARGFALGTSPSNFKREVVIDGPDAARRLAREALEILFDTLGYRGPQPLQCQLVADRRAKMRLTHSTLTARQVAFLLRRWGCSVLDITEGTGKYDWVRAQSGGLVFDVALAYPVGRTAGLTQLVLIAMFLADERAGLAQTNAFNDQFGPSRAIKVADGRTRLELVLPLITGLTEDYLRLAFDTFIDNMKQLDFIVSRRSFWEGLTKSRPN